MVKIHQHVKFRAIPFIRFPANARKPLRTDGRTVKRLRLVGWTNGPMYRSKESISGFGRTDGRTDGQPENIMPLAPKGGGIKTHVPAITLSTLFDRCMSVKAFLRLPPPTIINIKNIYLAVKRFIYFVNFVLFFCFIILCLLSYHILCCIYQIIHGFPEYIFLRLLLSSWISMFYDQFTTWSYDM